MQKANAAHDFLSSVTVPQVTRQFKCCARNATYIRAKAQDSVNSAEASPSALQHKTLCFVKYPDIEVCLFDFVQVARTARLPVKRLTLTARSLSIRERLLHATTDESRRQFAQMKT